MPPFSEVIKSSLYYTKTMVTKSATLFCSLKLTDLVLTAQKYRLCLRKVAFIRPYFQQLYLARRF